MIKIPDYKSNSILSLMTSIKGYLDSNIKVDFYDELKNLSSNDLKSYNNVIMLIVDGFGYEILKKLSNQSDFIYKACSSPIDTVLPSTTIAAITSFSTGISPKEHGMIGWNMKIKDTNRDIIAQFLPFKDKIKGKYLSEYGIDIKKYIPKNQFNERKNIFTIIPESTSQSPYFNQLLDFENNYEQICFYRHPIQSLKYIVDIIEAKKYEKQFIYSYFPHLDTYAHLYGTESNQVKEFYRVFKNALEKLLKDIKGSNSLVVITADHGLIDTKPDECLKLDDFNYLKKTLSFPLCGEARLNYIYVKDEYKYEFLTNAKKDLSSYGSLYPSKELLESGFFGPIETSSNFEIQDRIGDFTLIMKDQYILKDDRKNSNCFIGNHGSNSEGEIKVPLIVFN